MKKKRLEGRGQCCRNGRKVKEANPAFCQGVSMQETLPFLLLSKPEILGNELTYFVPLLQLVNKLRNKADVVAKGGMRSIYTCWREEQKQASES